MRLNSRVSGRALLDPPELKRHERLETARALVTAREKNLKRAGKPAWPLLALLSEALETTWHEARLAGRVQRHTEILRGVAHQLSNDPEREDRPPNSAEAKLRFEAHLQDLANQNPPTGLSAPTSAFINDLRVRTQRHIDHLFVCFDDPRIPQTPTKASSAAPRDQENARREEHEQRHVRTSATILIAAHQLRDPKARTGVRSQTHVSASLRQHEKIAQAEAPAARRVRWFDTSTSTYSDSDVTLTGPTGRCSSSCLAMPRQHHLGVVVRQSSARRESSMAAQPTSTPRTSPFRHHAAHARTVSDPGCQVERAGGAWFPQVRRRVGTPCAGPLHGLRWHWSPTGSGATHSPSPGDVDGT